MNTAVLSIGSNTANREQIMAKCMLWLKEQYTISAESIVYTTPAVNRCDADYSNAVVILQTPLQHEALSAQLKGYERSCGRTPESKLQGNIPIDLDIVIWNGEVLRQKDYSQEYFTIGWNEIHRK